MHFTLDCVLALGHSSSIAGLFLNHSYSCVMFSCSDICHELLGHVPLFADPSFAQFSQVSYSVVKLFI